MGFASRALGTFLSLALGAASARAGSDFDGYEIRVIRPRYFVKASKFEPGAGLSVVMNQSFIYSFLATGILSWHFTESLSLEGQGSYGQSLDREEKRILADDFGIHTIVLRTDHLASGRFVWTPSYGKYYFTNSRVVYFDTYVTAGIGVTGIQYTFDHCTEAGEARPAPRGKDYPTGIVGIGQRHFLDKQTSLRVGAEAQRFLYDANDGACEPADTGAANAHDNVILYFGWSRFL